MLILIVRGIISPISSLPDYSSENPLIEGALEGYNTMNSLGASLFGGWILKELSMRGIKDKNGQSDNLKVIGPIVAIALLFTSIGLTYIGATTGSVFPDQKIGILTMDISESLLGYVGKVIFAIITSIIFSIGYFLSGLGLTENIFSTIVSKLPLGPQGMGWIVPSAVVFILIQLTFSKNKKEV